MVTRSEWIAATLKAWDGEPCPACGRPMHAYHVDEEWVVWSYCAWCDREVWTAYERPREPLEVEEPDPEELPF
jgi:hypothetical protein